MFSPRLFCLALAMASTLGATASLTGCVERSTEHRIRANALFKMGDYRQALVECDRGLEEKVEDAGLWIIKGKTAFELGDFGQARAAYTRAVEFGRDRRGVSLAEAYIGLAMTATRERKWGDAREQFLKLLEINPTDGSSHANLARVDLELGKVEEAVQHAEEAARTRGNDEQVLFTLGKVYLAAARVTEAEKTFQHTCEVVPNSASCPYGLALVALHSGDTPIALAKLREAIARKIPHPEKLAEDPALAGLAQNQEFQSLAAAASASASP
jgi:tetratricopeptide (TPR) repeat protein